MPVTVFAWDSRTAYREVVKGTADAGVLLHNVVGGIADAEAILTRILAEPVFGGGKVVGDVNFRGHVYKIGMTNDVFATARRHENPLVDPKTRTRDPGLFDRMHVILRCSAQDEIRHVERHLIDFAADRFGSWEPDEHEEGQQTFSLNLRHGGAGRPSKAATFYAYVLLSRG